jgi:hypothetical protein
VIKAKLLALLGLLVVLCLVSIADSTTRVSLDMPSNLT